MLLEIVEPTKVQVAIGQVSASHVHCHSQCILCLCPLLLFLLQLEYLASALSMASPFDSEPPQVEEATHFEPAEHKQR